MNRKPRGLTSGFWDGFAEWDNNGSTHVTVRLSFATAPELRKMSAWMLRAADYMDWRDYKRCLAKRKGGRK